MTLPANSPDRASPSIAILGNDLLLAAAPATAVQLAHACLASGFDLAVPASWGDELIATETLRQLERRTGEPAILCACPFVADRLLATGSDLAPFLVSLVAPPVAVARFLRATFADHTLSLTYIGACPASVDRAIDERVEPRAFLDDLARRGIELARQPTVFDSVVPPDRRRWSSLPGGVPHPDAIARSGHGHSLFELGGGDLATEIAQLLIAQDVALIDLTARMGCVCAAHREQVIALEPPRATAPVVESLATVTLSRPLTVSARATPAIPPVAPSVDPQVSATDTGASLLTSALEVLPVNQGVSSRVEPPMLLPAGDADEHESALPMAPRDEAPREEAPHIEAPRDEAPREDSTLDMAAPDASSPLDSSAPDDASDAGHASPSEEPTSTPETAPREDIDALASAWYDPARRPAAPEPLFAPARTLQPIVIAPRPATPAAVAPVPAPASRQARAAREHESALARDGLRHRLTSPAAIALIIVIVALALFLLLDR